MLRQGPLTWFDQFSHHACHQACQCDQKIIETLPPLRGEHTVFGAWHHACSAFEHWNVFFLT
jgi:hypothetical protein